MSERDPPPPDTLRSPEISYHINAPAVSLQIMDGEAILIHFDSGRYYAADGTAGVLLSKIEQGSTLSAMARELQNRYGISEDSAHADVDRLVEQLVTEDLVTQTLATRQDGSEPPLRDPDADNDGLSERPAGEKYSPPQLETHSDLEDLLKLDPMHDVDDAGWPKVADSTR